MPISFTRTKSPAAARAVAACCIIAFILAGVALGGEPRILTVEPLNAAVPQYGLFELRVTLEAGYTNGFDSAEIQVNGQFQDPAGGLQVAGGFIYQQAERALADGIERVALKGTPQWRVRFTPETPGEYVYIISVITPGGRTFSGRQSFTCTASKDEGFVRRISGRYLEYDSGRPLFILGHNLAWAGAAGTYDYERWLERLAESGANFTRIWLWRNTTFDLELMPLKGEGGIGRFDLANAWRLDHVLALCEKLGIKVMLCFFDFHPLTENFLWDGLTHHPWDNCVYNAVNGGMLKKPAEFFCDEQAIAAAKQLVRYTINRFGHSKAIATWELFNEVDLAPGYTPGLGDVSSWHRRMAQFVSSIDPYRRPVTTSCAAADNRSGLWKLSEIQIAQSHSYNEKDMAAALPRYIKTFEGLGKPHLFGEIGCDVNFTADKLKDDPAALHLHNAIWAAMATGCAGGPLSWWWDSYIAPQNLYSVYTGPSKFAAEIQWSAEDFKPAEIQLHAANDDMKENVKLNAYVHGATHRQNLGSGPNFEVDYEHDGTFSLKVDKVCNGAILRIYLDGRLALWEDLPASKARGSWKDIIWQKEYGVWEAVYDRTFAITVPQGKHTISVRNDGLDWMMISDVKMLNYAERGRAVQVSIDVKWEAAAFCNHKVARSGMLTGYQVVPLRAMGLSGLATTIVWVQNEKNTWYDRRGNEPQPKPAKAMLLFPHLGPGKYKVQRWNTRTGEIEDEFGIEIDEESNLQFPTPPISTDTAYKIETNQ